MFKQEEYNYRIPQTIYLNNLTQDISEADLRNYFSRYGKITYVHIPKLFNGNGIVTIANTSIAQCLYNIYYKTGYINKYI